ncbi:MAG TPA: CYTH domain-containing protein [Brumimicrobium sp.]|nr:CYTH domain-containing protein [Brumimicrobium sp.]
MAIEIERKFLVLKEKWLAVKPSEGMHIVQGYLYKSPEKTIRVRTKGNQGFITIKGKTENISRAEYEYEIPKVEADELLSLFCPKKIDKVRYELSFDGFVWEVDEFVTPNPGLILAEIELSDENEVFNLPDWIGKEVSNQTKYYNANML